MIFSVIPFFLAARLIVNEEWHYGPEYSFQVQLNATAVEDDETLGSSRLNLAARLICQPRGTDLLSCHFRDSFVHSFFTESADPSVPVSPHSMHGEDISQISGNQFELKFGEGTLENIIVDENIHPRELDVIRSIVGQMNVGTHIDNRHLGSSFRFTEKFVQGECETVFKVDRKPIMRKLRRRQHFELESAFTIDDGHMIEIHKSRDLDNCYRMYPYFFANAKGFEAASDIASAMVTSDSRIILSKTEYTSSSWGVIKMTRSPSPLTTTLYEHATIRLETLWPASYNPPPVHNAKTVGLFIHTWQLEG